jgi:hypothetical protein
VVKRDSFEEMRFKCMNIVENPDDINFLSTVEKASQRMTKT